MDMPEENKTETDCQKSVGTVECRDVVVTEETDTCQNEVPEKNCQQDNNKNSSDIQVVNGSNSEDQVNHDEIKETADTVGVETVNHNSGSSGGFSNSENISCTQEDVNVGISEDKVVEIKTSGISVSDAEEIVSKGTEGHTNGGEQSLNTGDNAETIGKTGIASVIDDTDNAIDNITCDKSIEEVCVDEQSDKINFDNSLDHTMTGDRRDDPVHGDVVGKQEKVDVEQVEHQVDEERESEACDLVSEVAKVNGVDCGKDNTLKEAEAKDSETIEVIEDCEKASALKEVDENVQNDKELQVMNIQEDTVDGKKLDSNSAEGTERSTESGTQNMMESVHVGNGGNVKETSEAESSSKHGESESNKSSVSEHKKTVKETVVMREKSGRKEDDKTPISVELGLDVLGKMQETAEQRLAQRRQAREEARQIRMRELEKQQKEMEEKQDRIYELTKDSAQTRSYQGSRRGSDDSTSSEDTRELKKQLAEFEEKYKKAMMNNAQLDNEKQTYRYQVDEMKDDFVELEENYIESQRLLKERCRELEQKKRDHDDVLAECEFYKLQVTERDKLIQEYGLVFISNDSVEDQEDKKTSKRRRKKKETEDQQKPALVTRDALQILGAVEGNLDAKVKQLSEENKSLENEVKKLRQHLDEEREKKAIAEKFNSPPKNPSKENTSNGPIDSAAMETNMEAQKQLTEYRYKLKKAEQDITVLEGNVIRLESQVKRYKSTADESEKTIEDMKSEKRKMQREMRESQNQIAEMESQNNHLQKRLEKFKKERMDAIISGKS